MGAVELEHVEAGVDRHPRGAHEFVAHLVHVGAGHLAGHLQAGLERHGRGRHHRPVALRERLVHPLPHPAGGALGARVAELEADLRTAPVVDEAGHATPGLHVIGMVHPGAAEA